MSAHAGRSTSPQPGAFMCDQPLEADMAPSGDDGDGDDEWRFSLSDLEDEPETETEAEDDESGGSGVAGSFAPSDTIEPGDVDLENALFVVVGIVIGLAVVGVYASALL